MSSRGRVAALARALVFATAVLAVVTAIVQFPRGLGVLGCVALALIAGYHGVLHRGAIRAVGLAIAVAALAGAVVLLVGRDAVLTVLIVVGALASVAAARAAFGGRA